MRLSTTLLVAFIGGGCGGEGPPALSPEAVTPARGAEGSTTRVEITGQGLRPRLHVDFETPARSRVEADFRAELFSAATGARVALQDVAPGAGDREVLTATVPPGLPRGTYELTVTDPRGREATLRAAFRVVAPAEAVHAFRLAPIGPQRVGIPFLLAVTAVDETDRAVDGFDGTVTARVPGAPVTPSALGPFVNGRLTAFVSVDAPSDQVVLTVADPQGREGHSEPFAVTPGPAVGLGLVPASAPLQAGSCSGALELVLQDASGAPTTVDGDRTLEVTSGLDAVGVFADPGCTQPLDPVLLPRDEGRAQLFLRPTRAGEDVLRLAVAGLPAALWPVTVSPGAPAQVSFREPLPPQAAGTCSAPVNLELQDALGNVTSASTQVGISLSASPSGVGFFGDPSCGSPVSQLAIAPGASSAAVRLRADSAGTFAIRLVPVAAGLTGDERLLDVTP
jgi:hypothetical protein